MQHRGAAEGEHGQAGARLEDQGPHRSQRDQAAAAGAPHRPRSFKSLWVCLIDVPMLDALRSQFRRLDVLPNT